MVNFNLKGEKSLGQLEFGMIIGAFLATVGLLGGILIVMVFKR